MHAARRKSCPAVWPPTRVGRRPADVSLRAAGSSTAEEYQQLSRRRRRPARLRSRCSRRFRESAVILDLVQFCWPAGGQSVRRGPSHAAQDEVASNHQVTSDVAAIWNHAPDDCGGAHPARVFEVRRTVELLNEVDGQVLGTVINASKVESGSGKAEDYGVGYGYGAYGNRGASYFNGDVQNSTNGKPIAKNKQPV